MQLVAYGAQDIYLTGNPQITFFKVVYRRHTNFSMESIQQTFNGSVNDGGRSSVTISRNGDLVGCIYVEFNPNLLIGAGSRAWAPYLGNNILSQVEVEIGGQMIDKHYNHWLNAYMELTQPNDNGILPVLSNTGTADTKFRAGTTLGIDNGKELSQPPTNFQRMAFMCKAPESAANQRPVETNAWVPLQFWFCRNPGLALPLIALQYHEVKINITWAAVTDYSVAGASVANGDIKLWADYIYLDTDERRRFAQVSHEYLIEQVQYQSTSKAGSMDLNFNHPVKELIWSGQKTAIANVNGGKGNHTRLNAGSGDFVTLTASAGTTVGLKLNGHDRFAPRHSNYFTRTQVWAHHTGNPHAQKSDSIHVYSFALKPEEHQPSGTCNFSRIDNAQLVYSTAPTNTDLHIYAVNYNVLRIMSGMGGLAYSN